MNSQARRDLSARVARDVADMLRGDKPLDATAPAPLLATVAHLSRLVSDERRAILAGEVHELLRPEVVKQVMDQAVNEAEGADYPVRKIVKPIVHSVYGPGEGGKTRIKMLGGAQIATLLLAVLRRVGIVALLKPPNRRVRDESKK